MRKVDFHHSSKLPYRFVSNLTLLHKYLASKFYLLPIQHDSIHVQTFSTGVNRLYFYNGKKLSWLLFDFRQVDYVSFKHGKCLVRIADKCFETPCSSSNSQLIIECLLKDKFKIISKDEFISSDLILQLQDLGKDFKGKVLEEMEVVNELK
jgi:hypothetical protein